MVGSLVLLFSHQTMSNHVRADPQVCSQSKTVQSATEKKDLGRKSEGKLWSEPVGTLLPELTGDYCSILFKKWHWCFFLNFHSIFFHHLLLFCCCYYQCFYFLFQLYEDVLEKHETFKTNFKQIWHFLAFARA